MNFLKHLKKTDWLMLALSGFITYGMDFGNLELIDKVWLGCIVFWVVLLGVRIYIECRNEV